jgi:hypothetical protein
MQKISAINRRQTVISNIAFLPVFKSNLSPDQRKVSAALHRKSPSSPLLLLPSPSPSSSHATLVNAMARAALALFVDQHLHCHHHRPCHTRPLRYCHHHLPHALAVCHHPPSWSCGCLVNALLPATAHLCRSRCWLIVVNIGRFQTQGIHQWGGQGGHI